MNIEELRKEIGNTVEIGHKIYEIKEVGEDKEYGLLWIKEYQQEVKPTLKNKKICIIIGHGGSDTGAVSQDRKVTELAYNTEIAEKLAKVLEEQGYENFIHNRGYARIENTTFINSQNPDLVISLHCNSSDNLTATGTEAIHFPNSKNGIRFATILSKNVSEALGVRNRGAKEPYQGRGDGLLRRLKAPAVISEPFFININSDLKLGLERKNEYIEAILKSINEYFEIK
jgi:cell wall hydrolase/autolysin|nr:MAG TPA: Cell wall hydrolase autolysin [Caudoviricetes sp.]